MDRDKVIAVVLVVGFVFLLMALIGIVAVTGFILMFSGEPTNSGNATLSTPLIDDVAVPAGGAGAGSGGTGADVNDGADDVTEPPAPVCGNNKKETGEQCEKDGDCSTAQQCNATCSCENKPVVKTRLTSIEVTKLYFWCAPDFDGKKGLAIKYIEFKNMGASFSYDGKATITAVTGATTDSVETKAAFKFTIPTLKTLGLYQKDIARADAPYIFLGNTPDKTKITVDLGPTQYIEYEYTLKGNDFGLVGCL